MNDFVTSHVLVTHSSFVSIPSVVSVDGKLASKEYKTDSNNREKCAFEGKLGAFLVTKDSIAKAEWEKAKRKGKESRQVATLAKNATQDNNTEDKGVSKIGKRNVNNEYVMLALDGKLTTSRRLV